MRPGAGKEKGSAWELKVGVALSLWVSDGARADLFARTVLSGGQFTRSEEGEGAPGDLQANHPRAFEFMALFSVECKHHRDIGLDRYILDLSGTSFLSKVFKQTQIQAATLGLFPMVVAKQNHQPAIVLLDGGVGMVAKTVSRPSFHYHVLHNQTVLLTTFDHMLNVVRASPFLQALKTYNS